jgi:hypothetical protein
MADIRIKDLTTTASQTSSGDFIAIDGLSNGTRKLSATAPAFLTSVTTPSLTSPAAIDLTLAGGSSGASLVLGQGTTAGSVTLTPTGTGQGQFVLGNKKMIFGGSMAFTNPADLVTEGTRWGITRPDGGYVHGFVSYDTAASAKNNLLLVSRDDLVFSANLSERARFTSTGNLLIGTTSETGLTGAGGLKINSSTAGSASAGALVVTGGLSAGNNGNASYFGGAINAAGTVTMTATAGTTSPLNILNALGTGDIHYADFGQSGITFGRFKRPQSGLFTNQFLTETYKGYGINMNALGDSGGSYILADNGTARLTITSAGAATFAGAVSLSTAGTTVSIKSGTNAAAGTVTLTSGSATITSTAIDVNTVIVMSVKTMSGTVSDHLPSVSVAAGSATIDGHNADNSTYNWVALKVN